MSTLTLALPLVIAPAAQAVQYYPYEYEFYTGGAPTCLYQSQSYSLGSRIMQAGEKMECQRDASYPNQAWWVPVPR